MTGFGTNILHFWDTHTGDLLKTVEFHSRLYQVVPSPDGRSVALDVEATNQIWDAALMEPRHVFQIRGYLGTQAVNFSPSGKYPRFKYLPRHVYLGGGNRKTGEFD